MTRNPSRRCFNSLTEYPVQASSRIQSMCCRCFSSCGRSKARWRSSTCFTTVVCPSSGGGASRPSPVRYQCIVEYSYLICYNNLRIRVLSDCLNLFCFKSSEGLLCYVHRIHIYWRGSLRSLPYICNMLCCLDEDSMCFPDKHKFDI